jgi:vacuolar-type H+-ATPase subunit D/Vma8
VSSKSRTRSDRLRLVRQLELADRAVDLLRSKEEALERERVRLSGHATRAEEAWTSAMGEAADWLVRARMLGAEADLRRLASAPGERQVTVTIDQRRAMGVEYPERIDVSTVPIPEITTTAALGPATAAYRAALVAGADHGAVAAAMRRLDAELDDTRRRRRAIDEHLRPTLEQRRHDLELHLDEADREEALRVRVALAGATEARKERTR